MSAMRRNGSPASCRIEALESRTFLSASAAAAPVDAAVPLEYSAVHRDAATAKEVTHTTLKAKAGFLGQGSFYLVTVKTDAKFGSPAGTVTLLYHGNTIATLTLAPTTSKNKAFAASNAAYEIAPGGGAMPYYYGYHRFGASFVSSGSMLPSKGYATFYVKVPRKNKTADHLRSATIIQGSGTQTLQAGDVASMAYTGYLYDGGTVFDNSDAHSGFTFTEMASPEQVVKGFDEGALGMTVGETRVLVIPSPLGYGTTGSPPSIPANAKLVFLITLLSISGS